MLQKRKKGESQPGLQRTFVVLIHGGYWLIYLLLLAVIFAIAQRQIGKSAPDLPSLFPLIALCVAPNLLSFYGFYGLLFPRFLSRRKIFALVISGSLVCLAAALSGGLLSLAFFGFEQAIFADAREFFFLTASLTTIAAIHGGAALVIRGFITWYTEIKLKEELARKNFEMELALVKSQINPHFLFNTINNIDVLITKDAPLASAYLNKLSDILRYMVYETGSEKIPLAAELGYVEKYLELQKIRTANPDYVKFEMTGETGNLKVAPMILFPFIENAFKHTENKKSAHTIRIRVAIENEKMVFECENSYLPKARQKQDFGGLGNALVKKRLRLAYPEKHRLEIADRGEIYKVKLTIDLDAA
jgi:two-component system, LytTR family, sensor kinase